MVRSPLCAFACVALAASTVACTATIEHSDPTAQSRGHAATYSHDGSVADDAGERTRSDADSKVADAELPAADAGLPERPPGSVPVIVAAGRGGRNMISCDEGRTWAENSSETSATARCWGQPDNAVTQFLDAQQSVPNPDWIECDHNSGHTTGLVYHDGWFIKSMGWGTDGRTLRSRDGVTWSEPLASFKNTYMGLVALGDRLVAMGTPQPLISSDDAASWTNTAELGWDAGHVRYATSSAFGGASIVFITDKGIWSSQDAGASFAGPSPLPCAAVLGFASSRDVSVLASQDGHLCTTVDGGRSWTQQALARSLATNPVWNGKTFSVWGLDADGASSRFSSADGLRWTSELTPQRPPIVTVGVAASAGTYVATNSVWNEGYERQHFYRSDDGVTWETLPGSAFMPAHPIDHFASGFVSSNRYCAD